MCWTTLSSKGRSKGWLFLLPEESFCVIMNTILVVFFNINVFNIDTNWALKRILQAIYTGLCSWFCRRRICREIKSLLTSINTIAQEWKRIWKRRVPFKITTITVKIVLSVCSITTIVQHESESVLYYNSFPSICVQVGLLS